MKNWRIILKNILFLAMGVKAVLSTDGMLVKGILVFCLPASSRFREPTTAIPVWPKRSAFPE